MIALPAPAAWLQRALGAASRHGARRGLAWTHLTPPTLRRVSRQCSEDGETHSPPVPSRCPHSRPRLLWCSSPPTRPPSVALIGDSHSGHHRAQDWRSSWVLEQPVIDQSRRQRLQNPLWTETARTIRKTGAVAGLIEPALDSALTDPDVDTLMPRGRRLGSIGCMRFQASRGWPMTCVSDHPPVRCRRQTRHLLLCMRLTSARFHPRNCLNMKRFRSSGPMEIDCRVERRKADELQAASSSASAAPPPPSAYAARRVLTSRASGENFLTTRPPTFCDSSVCRAIRRWHVCFYVDSNHLSVTGARLMLNAYPTELRVTPISTTRLAKHLRARILPALF